MTTIKRLRGLAALVKDAVVHGSGAVERVHKETADRPFAILEHIPVVSAPTKIVHAVHDVTVTGVHATIRGITRAVGATIDVALGAAEAHARDSNDEPPE